MFTDAHAQQRPRVLINEMDAQDPWALRAVDHIRREQLVQPELPAELTITADGAFWSPFAPTVHDGALDTDLLITRTTLPLSVPAQARLGLVEARLPGEDSTLNIR